MRGDTIWRGRLSGDNLESGQLRQEKIQKGRHSEDNLRVKQLQEGRQHLKRTTFRRRP